MCINVIIQQKGVKFLLTAESVQNPFFLLITKRECSLVCKAPRSNHVGPQGKSRGPPWAIKWAPWGNHVGGHSQCAINVNYITNIIITYRVMRQRCEN